MECGDLLPLLCSQSKRVDLSQHSIPVIIFSTRLRHYITSSPLLFIIRLFGEHCRDQAGHDPVLDLTRLAPGATFL